MDVLFVLGMCTRDSWLSVGVDQSSKENAQYRVTGFCAVSECTSMPLWLAMDVARGRCRVRHICVRLYTCLANDGPVEPAIAFP